MGMDWVFSPGSLLDGWRIDTGEVLSLEFLARLSVSLFGVKIFSRIWRAKSNRSENGTFSSSLGSTAGLSGS